MRTKRVIKKDSKYYPQYLGSYITFFLKKKKRWHNYKRWFEGGFDRIGIPAPEELIPVCFITKQEALKFLKNQYEPRKRSRTQNNS